VSITNGDYWRAVADALGMPGRTLEQVQTALADAKRRAKGKNAGLDEALARLMLNHGRLTPDARAWIARQYPPD
jgi:hypothetical protein